MAVSVCSGCRTKLCRGKAHICTRSTWVQNVLQPYSPATKEQIASSVLTLKIKNGSSSISLASCQGEPVKANVGKHPVRMSLDFPMISHEGMSRTATDLGLSIWQTRHVTKHICCETGFRMVVKPRLDEMMQEMSHSLADFFEFLVISLPQRMSRESMFWLTDLSSFVQSATVGWTCSWEAKCRQHAVENWTWWWARFFESCPKHYQQ